MESGVVLGISNVYLQLLVLVGSILAWPFSTALRLRSLPPISYVFDT